MNKSFKILKMFKQHYYCLIAGLPDLVVNEYQKGLTSIQFRSELALELNKSDYELLEMLYRQADNKNLINLLLQRDFKFDASGSYPEKYLINQIISPNKLVEYMKFFINEFHSGSYDHSPLQSENKLQELFYDYVLSVNNVFIKQWFVFDRNIRNIITAVNCRKYGYPIQEHLIPDNSTDELYQALLQKNLKPELFVDEDLPYLAQIFQMAESVTEASEKEKAYDGIRWTFLDEISVFHYFTIEKILSFAIKLQIIDRWRGLDEDTGMIFLKRLIDDLELSYSFDSEFSLINRK